jgi:Icc-related predicted phosphoesterase
MVFSGSKTLNTLLKNPKYNFLVNIHGHTHAGTGRSNVNKVQVINPGSLKEGNFAILSLEKSEVSQTWIIKSTEFINLDAFY